MVCVDASKKSPSTSSSRHAFRYAAESLTEVDNQSEAHMVTTRFISFSHLAWFALLGCESGIPANRDFPLTSTQRDEIADTVHALTLEWLDRSSTPLDFDGFMDMFARDSMLIYVNSGRRWTGWQSLAEWHSRAWADWDSVQFTLGDMYTGVLGRDVAHTVAEGEYFIRNRRGRILEGRYVATTVWRNMPDGWKITQQHESFPR